MLGKYAVGLIIFVFVRLTYIAANSPDMFGAGFYTFLFVAMFCITLYCAVSGVYFLERYGLI